MPRDAPECFASLHDSWSLALGVGTELGHGEGREPSQSLKFNFPTAEYNRAQCHPYSNFM